MAIILKSIEVNIYKFRLIFLIAASVFIANGCNVGYKEVIEPFPAAYEILPEAININTATPAELEHIPHIGAVLASRIIQQRENYGKFRRPEHLMLVQGISDTRFRRIRPFIRAE